jgi:hypothetical protein
MIQISPRDEFRKNEAVAHNFGNMAHSGEMTQAVNAALGQYALDGNPSADQLTGVRRFLELFLNLAEPEPPMPKFPDKRLQPIPQIKKP